MSVTSFSTRKREETVRWERYLNLYQGDYIWNSGTNKVSLRQAHYSLGVNTLVVLLLTARSLSCRVRMHKLFSLSLPVLYQMYYGWDQQFQGRNNFFRKYRPIAFHNVYATMFIIFLLLMFYYFEYFWMVSCDITPYRPIQKLNMLELPQVFHMCK